MPLTVGLACCCTRFVNQDLNYDSEFEDHVRVMVEEFLRSSYFCVLQIYWEDAIFQL